MLTHCDQRNQYHIGERLDSIGQYTGLVIPRGNVILFDKTKESLKPLIPKLKPDSTMHLVKNLEQTASEILDELPNDFRRQDKNEGRSLK